jgi:mono/diheme cytochrome c family protein
MSWRAVAAGLAAVAAAHAASAQTSGSALFARCAACHLADGGGTPGAFPALRAQIGRFAGAPQGRAYLVSVVTHGLTGPLEASGVRYAGFMPAQGLSDEEAANLLTYVVHSIATGGKAAKPFTAAEVAALRRDHADATAQSTRALRPDALAGR